MRVKVLTMWTILCAALALSAAAAPKAGPGDAPGRHVRNLAKASLEKATAGVPIWNNHARVSAGAAGRPVIVPPSPILPGQFAVGRFRGEEVSWAGYDTMVLEVRSQEEGRVVILLSEYDDGKREDFTLLVESLPAGEFTLRFILQKVPDGDLNLSSLGGDGTWNPDDETGVNMILANYPKGFVIEGLRLEMSEISEGATN
jgi:hypothetical protein